jgi:hypothetical protein
MTKPDQKEDLRKKNMKAKILTTIVMTVAAVVVSAPKAQANAELELISGTTTSAVAVGGVAALAGVTINGWMVSFANGTTYPATGTAAAPLDDLASVNVTSTGFAPLLVEFSSTGFISKSPAAALAIESGTALSGDLAGTYTTYYDSSDTLFALTSLLTGPQAFNAINLGGTATGTVLGGGPLTPFSLTQVIKITKGDGSLDDSLSVTGASIPDGGMTLIMLGGAITALGLVRSKNTK